MTPKERMLAAYRGLPVDVPPVAPEFWYYFPAKVLGVDMITFQKEIPFWKALQETFRRYGTEGWGAAFARTQNPEAESSSRTEKLPDGRFLETTVTRYRGSRFESRALYDPQEPAAMVTRPVEDPADLEAYAAMRLSPDCRLDFSEPNRAHAAVGEDYLLELWLGAPFFDFLEGALGFEKAVFYLLSAEEATLLSLRERFIERQLELVRRACAETPYESFAVGCSSSCNSLLGPDLWRTWDKPALRAVVEEVHRHGRLVHVHFHGKSAETLADFAELGIDCVCPFERPPGGDIVGLPGLVRVRELLGERVTMNGNVHTVETLIRGTPEDVRREVGEIRAAFAGSRRFIVGTGDQVGRETPDENIFAMVEEARRNP